MNDKEVIFHYLYQKVKSEPLPFEYKFSNQYDIQTTGNIITIKKNDLFINHFYGSSISNLSIAVGSNGSGKTSLCEKLVGFIDDQSFYFETCEIVFIYSVGGKLFGNKSDGMVFSESSILFEQVRLYDHDNISWNKLLPVYLTFVFNYSSESILNAVENYSTFLNLSTTHLLKNAAASKEPIDLQKIQEYNNITFNNAFSAFKEDEFNRIFRISEYEELFKDFSIKIPTSLKVSLNKDSTSSRFNDNKDQNTPIIERVNTIWQTIANNTTYNIEEKFKLKFINKCVISIIRNYKTFVIPESNLVALVDKEINSILDKYFENPTDLNFIKEIYNKTIADPVINSIVRNLFFKYYFDIENVIDEIIKNKILNPFFMDTDLLLLNRKDSSVLIDKLKKVYYNDGIKYKPILLELSHPNSISSLSSGELALMSLFGRLLDIKLNDLPQNLFLMIDEADLMLHPQWQKKYLRNLLEFLNSILPNYLAKKHNAQVPKIQVLITTHSPIILSDVISNSVIYLDQTMSKNKSTFAQNIHELFNNEFILQDGLIGDYSQSKIDEIINTINTNEPITIEKMGQFLLTIKNIAEPFIQFKLIKILENKGNVSEIKDVKNRIIDQQIEKLNSLKA